MPRHQPHSGRIVGEVRECSSGIKRKGSGMNAENRKKRKKTFSYSTRSAILQNEKFHQTGSSYS
jgi:hypothetical protein